MSNKFFVGALLGVLLVGGGVFFFLSNGQKTPDTAQLPVNPNTSNETNNLGEVQNEPGDSQPNDVETSNLPSSDSYIQYSQESYEKNADKRRVLFFHAQWCPFCRAADKDFKENLSRIPGDVVVLQTDYDTQDELKNKYGVTYQHTFVQVDENGNEVTKWNSGGTEELLANIK